MCLAVRKFLNQATAAERNVTGKYCLADAEGWVNIVKVNNFKVFKILYVFYKYI